MIYGYARVSTPDQKLNYQTGALVSAGAETMFSDEGISGAKASRPGLDAMLDGVRPGDVVMVWRLDRLGRSVRHLLELAETLKAQGVTIRSLNDGVDTSGKMGGFLLTIPGCGRRIGTGNHCGSCEIGDAVGKTQGRSCRTE